MKCPKCNVELKAQSDRGVQVEACPKCQGMWLTPSELDQLENEAFSNEANKGSLYVTSYETEFKCPFCSAPLNEFDYRFLICRTNVALNMATGWTKTRTTKSWK
jgi:hypothetical protein